MNTQMSSFGDYTPYARSFYQARIQSFRHRFHTYRKWMNIHLIKSELMLIQVLFSPNCMTAI